MPKRRVLLTGAAGRIAPHLWRGLADRFDWRLLDIVPVSGRPDALQTDINDTEAMRRAMEGVDAVVHLAAQSYDADFTTSLVPRNITGVYSVYEAAQRAGVRRVVLASSYHVMEGYGPFAEKPTVCQADDGSNASEFPISSEAPVRPDGLYAVSKACGEVIARYFADYHGVTSVILRLGAVGPKSASTGAWPRTWSAWLAPQDFCQLVENAIEAHNVRFVIVYGISRNTRRLYDLEPGRALLGYEPEEDSELHLSHWYRAGPVPPAPPPPGIPYGHRLPELIVPSGRLALCWIGQAGFFVKSPAASLYIDPFISVWPDTLQAPLLTPAVLRADVVLMTHHHRDHLDRQALPLAAVASPSLRFAGPASCCAILEGLGVAASRLIALRPGERMQIADMEIVAMATRHLSDATDALGYVVRSPSVTIYHTGGTENDPVLLGAGEYHPDLLLVPINGRGGNMTAEQAAQLVGQLGVPAVVPMHYGSLQPQADLVDRFLTSLASAAPRARPAVMAYGAILYLPLRTEI